MLHNWLYFQMIYLPISSSPQPLATTILLSVFMALTTLDFIYNFPVSQLKKN